MLQILLSKNESTVTVVVENSFTLVRIDILSLKNGSTMRITSIMLQYD